ncbi:MAG TPA: PLP-dependent cysteine synthase family protein [Herpetosiphonaceae bacterium]
MSSSWVRAAIARIHADFNRSADTHLIHVPLPATPQIHLYMKDESTHVTGSLKHRLARSLFLYALCNGWITEQTPIIEASSGSTAISEAYFARLLGLRFIAVMAKTTSPAKIRRLTQYGGEYVQVDDPSQDCQTAKQLAEEIGGHFMDQFTYAERATDWRGNNNIAESIFTQLAQEPHPIPRWFVCGAGTGGTSATVSRYIRYRGFDTQVCVVDPEHSVFYSYYHQRDPSITVSGSSGVEGIGRPQVEPSFLPDCIDRMLQVPNAASYAALHFLSEISSRQYGGSTGTALYGALRLIAEMAERDEHGSVVLPIGDAGVRYLDTYYNHEWLQEQRYDLAPYLHQLRTFYTTGVWES